MNASAARCCLRIAVIFCLLQACAFAFPHRSHHQAKPVAANVSIMFMRKDGTCVDGSISRIDPKAVTIQPLQKPAVKILRGDLLQASQDDALLFSARSSWADVEAVTLQPSESFILKIRNGQAVKGIPLEVTDDRVVFKRFLWITKRYAKDQIVTVDYLRIKPESDAFDYFAQEGPALLFFYPEFYDRLKGLEGKVPVRLYDALRPEDNAQLKCSRR